MFMAEFKREQKNTRLLILTYVHIIDEALLKGNHSEKEVIINPEAQEKLSTDLFTTLTKCDQQI